MQAFRAIFAILPLLLTAGALLLLLLTVLSGAKTSTPLNKFYYLSADITQSGQTNPSNALHWTNYNVCGSSNGLNVACGAKKAAYGFAPYRQLTNPTPAVPQQLQQHDKRSYITSRVYYSFLLIALFFTFIAMLACLAGFFGRIGSLIGLVMAFFAWIMTTIAASLMTVVYVRGRNYFRNGGISSHVGVKLFAFMWAAMACLFLSLLIFAIGVCIPGENKRKYKRQNSPREKSFVSEPEPYVPVHEEPVIIAPIVDHVDRTERTTVIREELPRSSYERAPKADLAPPIDGLHTVRDGVYESPATGATYMR